MYARNGQGEISTFSLPESGASGNWGKSAAHRSGSLKEKTAKAATGGTGLVTDVAIAVSSKKRETPRDNQELADSSHSTMCPKPRKRVKMDQEADFVPETPPRGLGSTSTTESSPDNPKVDSLAPQLNIIMPTPLGSPEKGHHSDKLSSVVTIDPLLLYVRSEHPLSPAPEQTRPSNSPIDPPLPPTNPIPAEYAASEAPPSIRRSSIDPLNPEADFLRCLQGRVWSQARHKLLRLQEGAVQSGDMSKLLRYEYWEQCVAEKNRQPDFSHRVTADWQAFNQVV